MKMSIGNFGLALPFTGLYFLGDNGLQILTPAGAHTLLMEVIGWGGNNVGAGGTYAKRLVTAIPGTKVTLTLTATQGTGFVQAAYGAVIAKAFNSNGNTPGAGTGDVVRLGGIALSRAFMLGALVLGATQTATAGAGAGGPIAAGGNSSGNSPGVSGGYPAGAGGPSGQNGFDYGGGGGLGALGGVGFVGLTWT